MIILDTNVISETVKPAMATQVKQWLVSQMVAELFTTAVNLAEVSFGIQCLEDGRRKTTLGNQMQRVFDLYFTSRILPFDEAAARAYGRIVAQARAKGKSILIADGQIAAIAQVHGFTVATRDTWPFEAAGISVIDPWKL
jgi:toxin FitB